jgi:hypothetical protein
VDGVENKVADCLSHYYENDGPNDTHLDKEFVTADACLDPEGKLQPIDWCIELRTAAVSCSQCLQECVEQQVLKSNNMDAESSASRNKPSPKILNIDDEDILAINTGSDKSSLRERIGREVDFTKAICEGYDKNPCSRRFLQILKYICALV